jgi:hypothetical protein
MGIVEEVIILVNFLKCLFAFELSSKAAPSGFPGF